MEAWEVEKWEGISTGGFDVSTFHFSPSPIGRAIVVFDQENEMSSATGKLALYGVLQELPFR